jgi:hypothetical protein
MEPMRAEVLETIVSPDQIRKGDFGELLAVRFVRETPIGPKYLVSVYRESSADDGFVVTAYLTSRPSRRRQILWKR